MDEREMYRVKDKDIIDKDTKHLKTKIELCYEKRDILKHI